MRKFGLLLSMLVLVALVLTACGGEDNNTQVASPPPVTVDATEEVIPTSEPATQAPTEAATEPGTTTETPGVPVTGEADPARLSNQLDFTVWSQDGEQIGEVDDMVLDLEATRVAYVIVGTGGFLDLGEKHILVPWNLLALQTGAGDTTGGQPNAFVLQGDVEVFRNAPDFDLDNVPEAGQPAAGWDADIRTYWESGGTVGGTANTPAADATATPEMTATVGTAQGTVTGTEGQAQDLQGVVLATDVLGSTITVNSAQGDAQSQGQATADPNATLDPNATATTDPGTGQAAEDIQGTVDDMITNVDTGEILYIVVDASLADGERWIPVPLNFIQWDAADGAFLINATASTFQQAPFFANGEYPDTSVSGWNSEFDTFWQNITPGS